MFWLFFGTDIYLAGSPSPCHILYWSQEKKDLHRDDVADWEPQDPTCHRVMFGQSAPSVDHSEDFIEQSKLSAGDLWLTIRRNKKKQVLMRHSYITCYLFDLYIYIYCEILLAPRFHCQAQWFLWFAPLFDLTWQDRNSLALRLHYLARAKPMEDERTIKAQHVAPGTWFDP